MLEAARLRLFYILVGLPVWSSGSIPLYVLEWRSSFMVYMVYTVVARGT